MTKFEVAANIALFLMERTGSCLSRWEGRMSAKDQRALFGSFLGKGAIIIDGTAETVQHEIKVAFGQDCEVNASIRIARIGRTDLEGCRAY